MNRNNGLKIKVRRCQPSRHWPLKRTFCSKRNFSSFSDEEKLSSLDTALHFRIFLGTRARREKSDSPKWMHAFKLKWAKKIGAYNDMGVTNDSPIFSF